MILDDVRALLELGKQPTPTKQQKSEAKSHMQALRKAGFTNRDIFILSKEFYKENTIKQYMKKEETKNTVERDQIMKTIVDFVEREIPFEDIETALTHINDLEDITLEDETRLIQYEKDGADLIQLSSVIKELAPDEILQTNRLHKDLLQRGWNTQSLQILQEATIQHGGPLPALKALMTMGEIQELESMVKRLEVMITLKQSESIKLGQEKLNLETQNLAIKSYIALSKTLINEYSFDLSSLKTLLDFAKKYGPPWEALETINRYNHLKELEDLIEKQKNESAQIKGEINTLRNELEQIKETTKEAYSALGAAEEKLNMEIITQGLHDMLIDPSKTNLTRDEFLNTAYAITDGLIKYFESNPVSLTGWSGCKQSLEYVRSVSAKLIGKG